MYVTFTCKEQVCFLLTIAFQYSLKNTKSVDSSIAHEYDQMELKTK